MATVAPTLMSTDIRRMPTATDTQLLTLSQWLSPAFPISAFAYSHGVESAIAEGWISDAATLEDWLKDCLTHGTGRSDAIWLRLAHAAEDPAALDAQARAFVIGAERLREAERQGAAFVRTVNAVWGQDLPDLLLPIAVGQAARRAGLSVDLTTVLYLQSFASNLVSAALRLSPIGQTAGQRVIHALRETCAAVADETRGADLQDISGAAFLSDVAAMAHETLEPRLFQS